MIKLMSQKGLATILIVMLIALGIGGYLIYSGKINLTQKTSVPQQTTQSSPTSNVEDNWKTYTNNKHSFSVKYPQDWEVEDNPNAVDPSGITEEGQLSFQYNGSNLERKREWILVFIVKNSNLDKFKNQILIGYPNLALEQSTRGDLTYVFLATYTSQLGQAPSDSIQQETKNTMEQIYKSLKFSDQNVSNVSARKTYSKLGYSFKYPSNLFYSEPQNGYPHFYSSQEKANEAANCFKNRLGTLQKACNKGLFDVDEIDSGSDYSKDVEKSIQYEEGNTKNSFLTKYKDLTDREWKILGPVYGEGETVTTAEVNIDNTKHWIQIGIWDEGINSGQIGKDEAEQLIFIKKILNTVKFLD